MEQDGGHAGHGGGHDGHAHGVDKQALMFIHGALMLLGWCVLLPLGIMASVLRTKLAGE